MTISNFLFLSTSVCKILSFICNVIIFIVYGFICGKRTNKRGYLEGTIIGSSLLLIMFIISIIFLRFELTVSTLYYYLLLLGSSTLGSMFGKTKKDEVTL